MARPALPALRHARRRASRPARQRRDRAGRVGGAARGDQLRRLPATGLPPRPRALPRQLPRLPRRRVAGPRRPPPGLGSDFLVAAIVRRRGSIVRDLVVAAVVTTVMWMIVGRIVEGAWPDVWEALRAAAPPPWYPALRLAFPAAIVMTASPHLTRPVRRLGRWLGVAAAVGVTVLGATSPLGTLAGVLVAAVAAASVHLAFGSSGGRPSLHIVADRTRRARCAARAGSEPPTVSRPGFSSSTPRARTGEPLVVKVYGRDAHDAALLSTLWRTVWYREPGSPLRLGRLQQVEHEAFLTLLAASGGCAHRHGRHSGRGRRRRCPARARKDAAGAR